MSLIWNFPMANHSINNGLEANGMDQFRSDPYGNLARETIQNALDARIDKTGKVIIEFKYFETSTNSFPGLDNYLKTLYSIKKYLDNNSNSDANEKRFIENAIKVLGSEKLSWLRVSDYKTTGLRGASTPEKEDTPYTAFIKGAGKNQKDDNSGGSKGLGKNAIFINSDLQTMIASTYTDLKEKATIGVAKLVSYTIESNEKIPDHTQGIGFCVEDKEESKKYNLPFNEIIHLDKDFTRDENNFGTDIYIPAFKAEDEWIRSLIGEAIISFLPALINNELEIILKSSLFEQVIVINSETLESYISRPQYFKNRQLCKEAKSIIDTILRGTRIVNSGCKQGFEMSAFLREDNSYGSSKSYIYRFPTKMKIERRSIDNGPSGLTLVLFIEGDELAKRLRSVEDATHSKWSISRYKNTPYSKEEIREAIETVNKFINDGVNNFDDEVNTVEIDFDWSTENGWVCKEESGTLSAKQQGDSGLPHDEIKCFLRDDPQTHKKRRKPVKKNADLVDETGEATSWLSGKATDVEDGDVETSHPKGHNSGHSGDYHVGEEKGEGVLDSNGKKQMVRIPVAVAKCKMPAIDPENGWFKLILSAKHSGENSIISIDKISDENDSERVKIIAATMDEEDLDIENNCIVLGQLRKNREYVIDVTLKEKENYHWGINIYVEE